MECRQSLQEREAAQCEPPCLGLSSLLFGFFLLPGAHSGECLRYRALTEFPGRRTWLFPPSSWVVERSLSRGKHCKGRTWAVATEEGITPWGERQFLNGVPWLSLERRAQWNGPLEVASGQRMGVASLPGPTSKLYFDYFDRVSFKEVACWKWDIRLEKAHLN